MLCWTTKTFPSCPIGFWNDPDGVSPFDANNPLPLREEIVGGFRVVNRAQ